MDKTGILGNNKKITLESFKDRSLKIHNNRYKYDLVYFDNAHCKVSILCEKHGIFEQKVSDHLSGKGCKMCYFDSKKKDIDFLKNESIKLYGDIYDYSRYEYINSKTKSTLICKKNHHSFVSPNRINSGKFECLKCKSDKYEKRWMDLIKGISGFNYNFIKGEIIKIECHKCGKGFDRKVSTHYKLKNCIYCNPSKYTKDIFIEKSKEVHGDIYNYSYLEYNGSKNDVKLVCKNGHIITQNGNNHLNGVGCPKCNRFNKKENKLYEFIKEIYKGEIIQSDRSVLNGKELDIYLPELKIAFEFNGLYWHSDTYKDRNYHLNKTKDCLIKGIQLIHIWEDDWLYKEEIVRSIILNKISKSNRIFARKCLIKEVNIKEARDFLNKNHIQGFIGSKIRIGLYFEGELVSLMSFGSLRKSLGQNYKDKSYELLRFCNKLNNSVVGGASKLFNHFLNNNDIDEVISYSDNSRGTGKLYEKLGFDFISETPPNYYWIVNNIRKHRFNFRKDKLVKNGGDKLKTEVQIMNENGFNRIFDCGSKKFIYRLK